MTGTISPLSKAPSLALLALALLTSTGLQAQVEVANLRLAGQWRINTELSDNTDRQVEAAMRAAGERIRRRWFDNSDGRYRGGPPEHELYDRISYDQALHIDLSGESSYLFRYEEGYQRPVFTDNRSQAVSLTGLNQVSDLSLGHWEEDKLIIEARVRDGGFTEEVYHLQDEGRRLQAEFYIHPRAFQVPIQLKRVFDRIEE